MGSSAKTGKFCFQGSPEHFLDKNAIWDRTPPTYTSIAVYMCRERVQGSQIFKQNSIILIHSKVMAFLVISLSPWSPCCPYVVPIVPTSSPCHPCHPHIIPIAPRRSPCGPHGCGLRCLCGLHPMLSPWSPCCPRCPHIIPVIPMSSPSSPHHSHSAQKVPMWSPWLWSPWSPPHVIPVVPTSSLWSPHRPCVIPHHLHIV